MENDEENIFAGFRKFFEKNLNDRHGVKWFVESLWHFFADWKNSSVNCCGGGVCV